MGKTKANESFSLNDNQNRLSNGSKGISKQKSLTKKSSELNRTVLESSEQRQKEQDEQDALIRPEIQKRIYLNLKIEGEEAVLKKDLMKGFSKNGILKDDPRIKSVLSTLEDIEDYKLTKEEFFEILENNYQIIHQCMSENFVIPEFEKTQNKIKELFNSCKKNKSGKVADYIPELAKADPNHWGVSICSIDGQRCNIGDTKEPFSIQSTSKPISYAIALENMGGDKVHSHIGHEPSGVSFNAIQLLPNGLPHNPLINSGAIMTASLIRPDLHESERFSYVQKFWQKLAGGKRITYDNAIFLSERNTADTNFALAYLMKSRGAFPNNSKIDLKETLEFYFQCCSLQADCDFMSVVAATLANGGVCPLTGEVVLKPDTVKEVLSLMASCGMYDYSGEFCFNVGLPSKSGVAGAVITVIPGVMGVCTYAPPLDEYGNSAKGVQFCTEISKMFSFHVFQIEKSMMTDRQEPFSTITLDVLNFCAMGDLEGLKILCRNNPNIDLEASDYDGRTPLHMAATEGHIEILQFLAKKNLKEINPTDRWGNTPLEDAYRGIFQEVSDFVKEMGGLTRKQLRKQTKDKA